MSPTSNQRSDQPNEGFRRILVALDGSPSSDLVLDKAIGLARQFQAQLLLLHAVSPAETAYLSPAFAIRGTYPVFSPEELNFQLQQWQVAQETSLKLLQSYLAKAQAAGVASEIVQGRSTPGAAICTTAQSWNADLVVLGRRGHSGLGELLMGSVSNYVLHHAPCSVLTVQGQAAATGSSQTQSQPEQTGTISSKASDQPEG